MCSASLLKTEACKKGVSMQRIKLTGSSLSAKVYQLIKTQISSNYALW